MPLPRSAYIDEETRRRCDDDVESAAELDQCKLYGAYAMAKLRKGHYAPADPTTQECFAFIRSCRRHRDAGTERYYWEEMMRHMLRLPLVESSSL